MIVENSSQEDSNRAYASLPPNLRKGVLKKKLVKFKFERGHGKHIETRDRQWILRIYYSLQMHEHLSTMSERAIVALVSEISCCSTDSIHEIIAADTHLAQDNRGHPQQGIIPADEEEEIKDMVVKDLKTNLELGVPVSSKDVKSWLKESHDISLSQRTMLRYLKNWEINWKRLRVEEYRKAREAVFIQKQEFLRHMVEEMGGCTHVRKCKCIKPKKLVFIDESYVHQHHVSNFGLTLQDVPLQKPSGKGKRVVIAAAITEDGWLGGPIQKESLKPDMENVYEAGSIRYWVSNIGADYHENFNSANFREFFEECVLNNLTEPSIIVMDRARYHITYDEDEFFPSKAKKADLKQWLFCNKIKFNEKALKEELKLLATCHWDPPDTLVEQMAKAHGLEFYGVEHRVMYLPPYHPEFNAIEMAWGRVKDYIGKNPAYDMKKLLNVVLPEAIINFTPQMSKSIVDHTAKKIKIQAEEHCNSLDIEENMDLYLDNE